jgi:hypothetical protein
VPSDDYRSIRRAILDFDEFSKQALVKVTTTETAQK